tara:strand:+ start:139 stop:762 length:624 start_codon:yes stop_codon:yes gene_type:complete
MQKRFRKKNGSLSDTSFVVLNNQFAEVFKKPAIIHLVCDETNNKIRTTQRWGRLRKRHRDKGSTTGLKECTHSLSWYYLTMIGESRKDLRPSNIDNKMSIDGHLTMSRWILEMVRKKIKLIDECYRSGVVHIRNQHTDYDDKGRVVIVTHVEKNIENQKGGHHILRAEKYGWSQYENQIEQTIDELIRLRQVLADGYCDGDKAKGGE